MSDEQKLPETKPIDADDPPDEIKLLIVGFVLGMLIAGVAVGMWNNWYWHSLTVRHGAAHYIVTESGATYWKWNENKQEEAHGIWP
jgi:hypothetical protein